MLKPTTILFVVFKPMIMLVMLVVLSGHKNDIRHILNKHTLMIIL